MATVGVKGLTSSIKCRWHAVPQW